MIAVTKSESTTSPVSKTGDADDSINLIFLLNVVVVTLPYQTRYRHMVILISAESYCNTTLPIKLPLSDTFSMLSESI